MKELTILLLGVIFVTLIADSVQSISADHLELGGKGIFKDQDRINFAKTTDSNSKYQIHLQVEIRNAQGQLISIAETSRGNYIPHEISDLLFYEKLDVKPEIVTIDNIKYEKVQYVDSPSRDYDEVDYFLISALMLCGEIHGHDPKCMSVFQASTAAVLVTQTDVVTNHWTILRVMN
tara:strand:+ start:82 stop:612 length:531 start_codon:yes stop_codon:yes gene_type:complete